MNRRAKGEGAIFEVANGRYRAVLDLGWQGGKRVRKTWTCTTRREAAAKLRAALRLREDGFEVPDGKLTVSEFLERWLTEAVAPSLKPSATLQYKRIVRVHINPALGAKPLAKVVPLDLQRLYREKLASGLAPATVLYIHRILHRSLGQAERWAVIPRNPAALVDPPRLPRTSVGAFGVEEARAFIEAVKGDRYEALYLVALGGGLRKGEVLALDWADVNVEAGTVAVRHSLSRVAGGWAVSEPKTATSRRVVKLPSFALEALKAHRVAQIEERLAAHAWADAGIVFASEIGTHLDPSNTLKAFKGHVKRAGLDPAEYTFHSLRHSAATLMLALGVAPKVVAETLGHSRVGVTLDVYSHVLPHLQEEAANKMDRLLAGT